MNAPIRLHRLPALALAAASLALAGADRAEAITYVTIQPHTGGTGYVVTYSWKGTFGNGMDGGSNGSNAYIDDNTVRFSTNYQMTSGNHAGSLIRYSQHNNDGINGNMDTVPANGSGIAVDWDGSNGESLTAGNPMAESSHANLAFIENGGDWYNNPTDFGGIRFFGTGVQGALSLTSWNGIDSSSAFGSVQFEGSDLLGQGMQFGVNGSAPGAADSARFGMVGDAKYWNDLNASGTNNGLLIGFFPYAADAPSGSEFIDQFNLGTYTTTTGDITMYIVNDPNFIPVLVSEDLAVIPEPSSTLLLGLGAFALVLRRRR